MSTRLENSPLRSTTGASGRASTSKRSDRARPTTSSRNDRARPTFASRSLAAYYALTPGFALIDFLLGWNVRLVFLQDLPAVRVLYYLACLGVGYLYFRGGARHAALAGLLECSVNLLVLALSVVVPLYSLFDAVSSNETIRNPFTPFFIVNLIVSTTVFLLAFYANPLVKQSTRLPHRWGRSF